MTAGVVCEVRQIEALYPWFRAEDWFFVRGRGDVAMTTLDRDTKDFAHLIGEKVLITSTPDERSGLYHVHGVERFAHSPPWYRGEKIGLWVEVVP